MVRPLCSSMNCFFCGAATRETAEARREPSDSGGKRLGLMRIACGGTRSGSLVCNKTCVFVYVCVCVRTRDREGRETWAHSQWNATCAEHVCRSVRAPQLFDTPSVGPYIKPDTYIKHFTLSSAAAAAAVCRQTSVCVSVCMSVRLYCQKKKTNASIYK